MRGRNAALEIAALSLLSVLVGGIAGHRWRKRRRQRNSPGSGAKGGAAAALPDDGLLDAVQRSCVFAMGLKVAEGMCALRPLYRDPLGQLLAGPLGTENGVMSFEAVVKEFGPGGHAYFSVRNYLLDIEVVGCLRGLARSHPEALRLQVVNVGAGLDTRPWRLTSLPPHVHWLDLDQPQVLELKAKRLAQAGAQLGAGAATGAAAATAAPAGSEAGPSADASAQAPAFPLQCAAYHALPCTLSAGGPDGVAGVLRGAGPGVYDPDAPTVWIFEGLLYYLDAPALHRLFQEAAALSCAGSRVLATVISRECMEAMRRAEREERVPRGFTFLTCLEDLLLLAQGKDEGSTSSTKGLGGPGCMAAQLGWALDGLSPDFRQHLGALCPGEWAYPPYRRARGPGVEYLMALQDVERLAVLTRV